MVDKRFGLGKLCSSTKIEEDKVAECLEAGLAFHFSAMNLLFLKPRSHTVLVSKNIFIILKRIIRQLASTYGIVAWLLAPSYASCCPSRGMTPLLHLRHRHYSTQKAPSKVTSPHVSYEKEPMIIRTSVESAIDRLLPILRPSDCQGVPRCCIHISGCVLGVGQARDR